MELPAWMPIIFYAVVITVFIGVFSSMHLEANTNRKYFSTLVALIAIMLINDFLSRMYIYPGFPTWIVIICTYINFLLLPAIGMAWYWFVRSVLTAEQRYSARALNVIILIVACIGFVSLLTNPFTHAVFAFDSTGLYHRGPLFFFPAGSTFICIVIAEAFVLRHVRNLGRDMFTSMVLFPVPPLVGGIVAMFIYGIPWMPLGISISMVMLFASTFTSGMNTDYLTSIINRRRIEELLDDRIEAARAGRKFAGLMVDIDNFKILNDTLGHGVGDEALADTATLLQKSLRRTDVVGRFGGDEFFALLNVNNEQELESVVARIRDNELRFEGQEKPYSLRLSKGYAMFDPQRFPDARSFENYLDELMYADKHAHKAD